MVEYGGRLKPTLDFAERHRFWLSNPNHGRGILNSESNPTSI